MDSSDTSPRPEIALSWQRSRMSGLTPACPNLRIDSDSVDPRSRLVQAAQPVLAELADQLGDTRFAVVLADRQSRIVDMPVGTGKLRTTMESLGVVEGGVFLEETTGTNSIATVYETRRGIGVRGDEHYLDAFKQFSCYGHPIMHPVTRRLEGVLDITCLAGDETPLLGPFLARAARDIEERLLQTARAAEQRMLAAFHALAAGRNRPVLLLSDTVVLANTAAVELLDAVDHIRLRELAAEFDAGSKSRMVQPVRLSCGRHMSVRLQPISPGADGVLFEFLSQDNTSTTSRRSPATQPWCPAEIAPGTATYIGGAPGTGRTTTARSLAGKAGQERLRILDASNAASRGDAAWIAALEEAAQNNTGGLIVENAHLLPDTCSVRLQRLLDRHEPWIAMTGAPLAELSGHAAALAASCPGQIELPKLRDRAEELPELMRVMLDELGVGDGLRFTPSALAALANHPWPGNLRELRTVVRAVVGRRSAGDVTLRDLPEPYQVSPHFGRMTPLQRAEHDAIAAAMRECGGNKLRAAQQLGISRTTLYNRMRALRMNS